MSPLRWSPPCGVGNNVANRGSSHTRVRRVRLVRARWLCADQRHSPSQSRCWEWSLAHRRLPHSPAKAPSIEASSIVSFSRPHSPSFAVNEHDSSERTRGSSRPQMVARPHSWAAPEPRSIFGWRASDTTWPTSTIRRWRESPWVSIGILHCERRWTTSFNATCRIRVPHAATPRASAAIRGRWCSSMPFDSRQDPENHASRRSWNRYRASDTRISSWRMRAVAPQIVSSSK